jgi:hypothetical protein
MATVEPEGSAQGAQQALASASVTFAGCQDNATVTPSLILTGVKALNYTTYTWGATQSVTLQPLRVSLTRARQQQQPQRPTAAAAAGGPASSSNADAAAAGAAAAAVNVSAIPLISRRAPSTLVVPVGQGVTSRLVVSNNVTRLPGVTGSLFGLEGQLVASAPGRAPMPVTGVSVLV